MTDATTAKLIEELERLLPFGDERYEEVSGLLTENASEILTALRRALALDGQEGEVEEVDGRDERAALKTKLLDVIESGADRDGRATLPQQVFRLFDRVAAVPKLIAALTAAESELTKAKSERDELVEALEIIAGKRQCLDNLMGNVDVALAALARLTPEKAQT